MAASDIVGGTLIVDLKGGGRHAVNLDEREAFDLMAYARRRQLAKTDDTPSRRIKPPKTMRRRDEMVWDMRQRGMCVTDIAHALGISQASVSGSLRRVAYGRYGEI